MQVVLGVFLMAAGFSAWADQAEFKTVGKEKPFVSDDGSIIRNMPKIGGVESVHCRLPKDGVIQASQHKTVSQIWYVSAGMGEIWLKSPLEKESITPLRVGTALTVPLGYSFQFKNTGKEDLEIFIVNTTPWSGEGELIPVENHWPPKISKQPK